MAGRRAERISSRAELVKRIAFGESDLVVTFFTERAGSIAALARGGRASKKRFAGLEPMHLLEVEIDWSPGRDLCALVESRLARPRLGLTGALDRLDAAGHALRWVAAVAPPHAPDPGLWEELESLLDALDAGPPVDEPAVTSAARLGAFGLRLLGHAGWALELEQCVRCGRPCPERAAGRVDVAAGGLVCRSCGQAPLALTARERSVLVRASTGDVRALERPADAALATRLSDLALEAHGRAGA